MEVFASMDYSANGDLSLRGCAGVSRKNNYAVRFAVGQRAWVAAKARSGRIESVVIKRHRLNNTENPFYAGFGVVAVYTDTLNRVWMEDELVNQAEAEALLESYNRVMRGVANDANERGLCLPLGPEGCA